MTLVKAEPLASLTAAKFREHIGDYVSEELLNATYLLVTENRTQRLCSLSASTWWRITATFAFFWLLIFLNCALWRNTRAASNGRLLSFGLV